MRGETPEEEFAFRLTDQWNRDEPTLTADQVQLKGIDPNLPNLLRFTDRYGITRYFEWQFGVGTTRPLQVVRAINEKLEFEDNPHEVISRWLDRDETVDEPLKQVLLRLWAHEPEIGLQFAARLR